MRGASNDDDDGLWRRLDWNDVRIFLAVAESGSLNSAARSLGMTQPTISRRMEDLEYRLGARLLSRSSRGIELTDAGAAVRDLAANMARLGGTIMREVAGRDRTVGGRVRLAAPDGLASFILMPRLAEFQRTHPEIHLSVDCGLWNDSPLEGAPDLSRVHRKRRHRPGLDAARHVPLRLLRLAIVPGALWDADDAGGADPAPDGPPSRPA